MSEKNGSSTWNWTSLSIGGRLTVDPKLHKTGEGKPITTLRVAVNDYKGTVQFWKVTLVNSNAENACKYLSKGDPVRVQGRPIGEVYDGNIEEPEMYRADDGIIHSVWKMLGYTVRYLPNGNGGTGSTRPTGERIKGKLPGEEIPFDAE